MDHVVMEEYSIARVYIGYDSAVDTANFRLCPIFVATLLARLGNGLIFLRRYHPCWHE